VDWGETGFGVAVQLQLDPVRFESLTRQLGGKNGGACGDAPRSIGQQPITAAKNVNQTLGITLQADPADRGRDQFRSARFEAIEHDLLVRISSRADDQPGGERRARNYKRIIHNSLSWRPNLCDPTETERRIDPENTRSDSRI